MDIPMTETQTNSFIEPNSIRPMDQQSSVFPTVDSVLRFLLDPSPTITNVLSNSVKQNFNDQKKAPITRSKRKPKEKDPVCDTGMIMVSQSTEAAIEIKPQGRVRYGPITVNPRKNPSKTLFTGRRSKYEVLTAEEEEERRVRRQRNRIAATKCREKRENILSELENQYDTVRNENDRLSKLVQEMQQRKSHLESILNDHKNCLQRSDVTSMVFGNSCFLSNMIDATLAPTLPLPLAPPTANFHQEEMSPLVNTGSNLINSSYDPNANLLLSQQNYPSITMTSSSLDRLLNSVNIPASLGADNSNAQALFNSAPGASSCARQHNSSSEDDSMASKSINSYVC